MDATWAVLVVILLLISLTALVIACLGWREKGPRGPRGHTGCTGLQGPRGFQTQSVPFDQNLFAYAVKTEDPLEWKEMALDLTPLNCPGWKRSEDQTRFVVETDGLYLVHLSHHSDAKAVGLLLNGEIVPESVAFGPTNMFPTRLQMGDVLSCVLAQPHTFAGRVSFFVTRIG